MTRFTKANIGVWAVVVLVAAAVAGVFTYAAVFESRAAAFYDPPSDDEMIHYFQEHEQQFAQLLGAYQADLSLEARIDELEMKSAFSLDLEDVHEPELREYLEMREQLGVYSIEAGRGGGWELMTARHGLLHGWAKGYLYSDLPPSPLVSNTSARPEYRLSWVYRHIQGDWYLCCLWE